MLKYSTFINEDKTNKPKNFELYYSRDFGTTIGVFKSDPISTDIINCYGETKTRYTYLDITDNDDIVSYIQSDVAKDIPEEDAWTDSNRQQMKIGRMINKLFPDKYNAEEIEIFVNQYKSVMRENRTFFKLFSGEEITQWYSEESTQEGGTLGNSCMRYDRCEQYLDLYTNNPQKIKLLVLFEQGSSKIIGRALIWYLDSHGHSMMDRIYTTHDSDINLFKRYAYRNDMVFSTFDDEYNGLENIYTILKPEKYQFYPYLDTLNIYQPDTGILTDSIRNIQDDGGSIYVLDDTYGFAREHKI